MAVIAQRSGTRERHEDIFAAFKSTECLPERARAQKSAEDGHNREAIRDARESRGHPRCNESADGAFTQKHECWSEPKMAVIAKRSGTRKRHEDIFATFKSTLCF